MSKNRKTLRHFREDCRALEPQQSGPSFFGLGNQSPENLNVLFMVTHLAACQEVIHSLSWSFRKCLSVPLFLISSVLWDEWVFTGWCMCLQIVLSQKATWCVCSEGLVLQTASLNYGFGGQGRPPQRSDVQAETLIAVCTRTSVRKARGKGPEGAVGVFEVHCQDGASECGNPWLITVQCSWKAEVSGPN